MGREVRKVPENYQHPRHERTGDYLPLMDNYEEAKKDWLEMLKKDGYEAAISYYGTSPDPEDYMLVGVPDDKRTHYMMFEDTSEGTPLSPSFATTDELIDWLVKNNASYFGKSPGTREDWQNAVNGGFTGIMISVPSGVSDDT